MRKIFSLILTTSVISFLASSLPSGALASQQQLGPPPPYEEAVPPDRAAPPAGPPPAYESPVPPAQGVRPPVRVLAAPAYRELLVHYQGHPHQLITRIIRVYSDPDNPQLNEDTRIIYTKEGPQTITNLKIVGKLNENLDTRTIPDVHIKAMFPKEPKEPKGKHKGWYKNPNNPHHPLHPWGWNRGNMPPQPEG